MSKRHETSWLGMLKMELSLIDKIVPPSHDIDEKDATTIGVASDEAKRLWTYYTSTEEKATRTLIDAKYCRNREEKEDLMKRACELRAKAEMARNILFLSIRDQFGIWNPTVGVGLGKDFSVITFKDEANPLLDLLRGGS